MLCDSAGLARPARSVTRRWRARRRSDSEDPPHAGPPRGPPGLASVVAGRVVGGVGDAPVPATTALGVVGAEVTAQPVGTGAAVHDVGAVTSVEPVGAV